MRLPQYEIIVTSPSPLCTYTVVVIEPSAEDRVVNENAGTVTVCLMKDKNTSRPFEVNVYPHKSDSASAATGNAFIL